MSFSCPVLGISHTHSSILASPTHGGPSRLAVQQIDADLVWARHTQASLLRLTRRGLPATIDAQRGRPANHRRTERPVCYYRRTERPTCYHQRTERSVCYYRRTERPTCYHQRTERSVCYHRRTERPTCYHRRTEKPALCGGWRTRRADHRSGWRRWRPDYCDPRHRSMKISIWRTLTYLFKTYLLKKTALISHWD